MIDKYQVYCQGHVYCRSSFYQAHDHFKQGAYVIQTGKNVLKGDIDSGNWALSYLLSMYNQNKKDFLLPERPQIINKNSIPMEEILSKSCYMDEQNALFSTKRPIRNIIERGIQKNNLPYTANELRDLFGICNERFERPMNGIGNDRFKAMSAIGLANNKEWFCFPWLSSEKVEYYQLQLSYPIKVLEQLEKIIIFPCGQ